ncbi:hypothetical protein BGZ46_010680 [Entomortierella lignicola]|nr:hypothetical protein BGZ46_010680 [Entomortierella lignicola]
MVSKSKKNTSIAAKVVKAIQHKDILLRPSIPLVATAAMRAARKACEAKVDAIVAECHENNTKFRDTKFDLLDDSDNCLYSTTEKTMFPGIDGSKRVKDLFRNTTFFQNGASPDDIKQGMVGDCWFLAALAVVSNIPGLLEQLCVKRDEEVGVYGFIFFKDGDWVSTVVDDQLYYVTDRQSFKNRLYFSSCRDERETWLPLMEKAYAKIHGDYESISGGYTSEGIEDLTGGVASTFYTADILSKDRFWEEQMKKANKSLLLGCWVSHVDGDGVMDKNGIQSGHAYSVLRVAEFEGERLVLVRNPWGYVEWNGEWSDVSDKWTPEAKVALDYKDSDDGQFWMSYKDFTRIFTMVDRCRVFDSTWNVNSSWIPYNVAPRSSAKYEYHTKKGGDSVVILTQPDTRYFASLTPEYEYSLSFHIYDKDKKLVKRSRKTGVSERSVSCEVNLSASTTYTIIPFVTRTTNNVKTIMKNIKSDFTANAVLPSQGNYNVEIVDEPIKVSKDEFMFLHRKASTVRDKSIARLAGQTLLGVEEDEQVDPTEVVVRKEEDWEMTIGIRIYSHDPKATLEGIPGEHPSKTGVEATSDRDDPEAVTATLADKKSTKDEKADSDKSTKDKKEESEKSTKDEKEESEKSTKDKTEESEKSTKDEKAESEKTTKDEKEESEKSTKDEKAKAALNGGKEE